MFCFSSAAEVKILFKIPCQLSYMFSYMSTFSEEYQNDLQQQKKRETVFFSSKKYQ